MTKSLLVFTETYARGGGNRYAVDLVNAIADSFDETVFSSNPGGLYPEDLLRLKRRAKTVTLPCLTRAGLAHRMSESSLSPGFQRLLSLTMLPLEPLFLAINVLRFRRFIRKLNPALILVCNGGYPASHACLAMVLAGRSMAVSTTMSVVSMPTARRRCMGNYDRFVDKVVWRSVSRVVVNANIIKEALVAMRSLPPSVCAVVPNGLEEASSKSEDRNEEKIVIGFVARLSAMKGVLVLLDAFSELTKRNQQLHLVLAGDGESAAEVAKLVRQRRLESNVTLLGHYSADVHTLLSSFDIYALPSLWEGLPYGLLEAMRSSCSIVATRVGGIPEAITDGVEGLLVEPNDTTSLITALERLLANPGLRKDLASRARQRFDREFSLSSMHQTARRAVLEGLEA